MAKRKGPEKLIDAAIGNGCSHCEIGIPIDQSEWLKVMIKLCLECVLLWYRGWTVTEWEAHHAPLADHLGDRIQAAIGKKLRDGMKELMKGEA